MLKILTLLLLTSCGADTYRDSPTNINEELLAQVEAFEDLYGAPVENIEIDFGEISIEGSENRRIVGVCSLDPENRKVTINEDFWNTSSEARKRVLIFHELGHCILFRRHDKSLLDSGRPESLMYPLILSEDIYLNNQDYYDNELFELNDKDQLFNLTRGVESDSMYTHISEYKEI